MPLTKFTTKVKIGDQEHEVEVMLPEGVTGYEATEIREGFIPKQEFNRRTQKLIGKAIEERLADDEFKSTALKTWGINLDDQGKAITGEELERAIKQKETDWTSNVLKPVADRADRAELRVNNLLNKTLASQIVSAAKEVGVKDEFLKPARPGQPPMIVKAISDVFGFDEETDQFLALNPEDPSEYAMSKTPTAQKMYMDVAEFVQTFIQDNPALAGEPAKPQTGPGVHKGAAGARKTIPQQIAEAETAGNYAAAAALKAQLISRQPTT